MFSLEIRQVYQLNNESDVPVFLVCTRSIWQRAGAVRLFVEHVTLCDERDDGLNPESVVLLWKVQTKVYSAK